MPKQYTLTFLQRDREICLAMKKRGFGEGNWNGYGGKIEKGETVEGAAVREIFEESGVTVREESLEKSTINEFFFVDGAHLLVHVFFVRTWKGDPVETEEMRPAWFLFSEIPYDEMWEDDQYWLPRALLGERQKGKCWFDESGKHIKKMEWKRVTDFS